jgi:hypothetical protein
MSGYSIDHYNRRRKQGELLPHTAFQKETLDYEVNNCSLLYTFSNGDSYTAVPDGTPSFVLWCGEHAWLDSSMESLYAPSDLQQHVIDAASRINGNGHDSLTFLVEVRKLRRLFKGVVSKTLSLMKGKSPGQITNLWLEARYGWRTLLYDLEDLDDAIRNFNVKRSRFSERSGLSYNQHITDTASVVTSAYSHSVTSGHYINVSARGAVTADITPSKFQFQPARTAWELVPFSFVLDWFVDVGAALEAQTFLFLANGYEASTGYRLTVNSYGSSYGASPIYPCISASISSNSQGFGVWERRMPATVSLSPPTRINLDTWKILDLISLLWVIFKKEK